MTHSHRFDTVPVVDISCLHGDSRADKSALAEQLAEVSEKVGFMYIKGHGISDERIAALRYQAQRFFELPSPVYPRCSAPESQG